MRVHSPRRFCELLLLCAIGSGCLNSPALIPKKVLNETNVRPSSIQKAPDRSSSDSAPPALKDSPGEKLKEISSHLTQIDQKLNESSSKSPAKWTDIFTAIIASITLIFGPAWLFYWSTKLKPLEIRLKYVEDQLEHLYGPLLADCLRAESEFRRVQLLLEQSANLNQSANFNHRDLLQQLTREKLLTVRGLSNAAGNSPLHATQSLSQPTSVPDPATLFAWAIDKIYLKSNHRKVELLSKNVHLYGPYPPLSFSLFLSHASQFESLVGIISQPFANIQKARTASVPETTGQSTVKAGNSDQPTVNEATRKDVTECADEPDYKDIFTGIPYPVFLTGEVAGKVTYLKALQREYQLRIGQKIDRGEIFYRRPYYLAFEDPNAIPKVPSLRKELNDHAEKMLYNEKSLPLLWGPYTGIELLEMRSWLIGRELLVRGIENIKDMAISYRHALNAFVATIIYDRENPPCARRVKFPIHYRVGQLFDEIDQSGSKAGIEWTVKFCYSNIPRDKYLETEFQWYDPRPHEIWRGPYSLARINCADGFAYDSEKLKKLFEDSDSARLNVLSPNYYDSRY